MKRPDRTISVVVTADQFASIDMAAARFAVSPAELLRRIAAQTAELSDALHLHGMNAHAYANAN
ncbi:hypothetical protein [Aureimonas sp. AU40]|uniref:hypothetical protein n=1 Tax=Aureimonas sp. AU40 TaxID=1637747 RepID=UPI0012E3B5A4|nr:hypothetical protein [Aureimonas sp. AU40]